MRSLPTLLIALFLWPPHLALPQSGDADTLARLAQAGQQALAAGHFPEARENFERIEKLQPNVAEVHATLAVIYFKLREYPLAVQQIGKAQGLKPGLSKLDSLLGLSLAEMGDFDKALPHLEKGFKQTADAEVRRMCGLQLLRAYLDLRRDADAVEVALALNKSYPDDPEVLYHTGRVYGNQAYVVMEKLHDSAPDSVWMLQAQGEANESEKNYDAAIGAFEHVLAVDPRRAGIHYRIGRVYLSRYRDAQNPQDKTAAQREFMAELDVDPGNGNAAYELAQMAADDNKPDEARNRFEALLARFPDFEQALVGLGGVYLQSRSAAQAVTVLQRAAHLDPQDEVAWYRLALAQREAGDRESAQQAMDTFRKLHRSSSAARNAALVDEITPQKVGSPEQP